ncbi:MULTISPECIES: LuxR C-terminal-related transcriptional regulator [Streptomyces]|uniref:LuxR C-terminal-related transcriptional regulator n=1 Tax=Streptomyces edwardsiae TaxID=3075527 RepID=A0ABU2Q6E2_9ACTN|nr:LuxR C-terminal-related transcriptional regulator [Streptomyces sp. DSM 41636]MDT0399499.1 LuxR C-terminal-related transcriptional regulator [Streptomyces sp. DSM 41636]
MTGQTTPRRQTDHRLPDHAARAHRYTAAAARALLAGHSPAALRLLDAARSRPAPASVRGGAELLRGSVLLTDGPVADAHASLLLAATLLAATDRTAADTATLAAAEAAWSAGDPTACLHALALHAAPTPATPTPGTVPGRGAPATGPPPPGIAVRPTADAGTGAALPSGVPRPPGLPSGSGPDAPVAAVGPEPEPSAGGPRPPGPSTRSEVSAGPAGRSVAGGGSGSDVPPETVGAEAESPADGHRLPGLPGGLRASAAGASSAGSGVRSAAGGGSGADGRVGLSSPSGPGPRAVAGDGSESPACEPPSGSPGPGGAEGEAAAAGGGGPGAGGDAWSAVRGRTAVLRDHRDGMRDVLLGRFDRAAGPLRRVVAYEQGGDGAESLLRAASAALMLGDVAAARRAGARALAAARVHGCAALEPRALEYLAYAELRAGRHQLARTHAEEGLRTASRTGQRNTAAHHHAVLALAASIEGERDVVAEHVEAALRTARRHGLAQAATLAQWAAARADLGAGRPREAADRLGPLVRPGARRGHFAVWMLAVPCFVEATALAGRPELASSAVEDFAVWAGCRADPQAPAQLLRCRALLAAPDEADALYRRALDRHEETAGDFERARTELLYGKWLRRRRRLREARTRLGEALMGFERCGAHLWAEQAAAESRAGGAAPGRTGTGDLSALTPQQLRIARCVAEGATNREVALSLSVSTRTVDYHLRNIFATLGVRSRVELVRLVEQAEKTGARL